MFYDNQPISSEVILLENRIKLNISFGHPACSIVYNIIFLCLVDSDWLRTVPINH